MYGAIAYIYDYILRAPGVVFCLVCVAATIFCLYFLPQGHDLLLVELRWDSEWPEQSIESREWFFAGAVFFTFAIYFSLRLSSDYVSHEGKEDFLHKHHLVPIGIAILWLATIALISAPAIIGTENNYAVAGLGVAFVVSIVLAVRALYSVDRDPDENWVEQAIRRVTGIKKCEECEKREKLVLSSVLLVYAVPCVILWLAARALIGAPAIIGTENNYAVAGLGVAFVVFIVSAVLALYFVDRALDENWVEQAIRRVPRIKKCEKLVLSLVLLIYAVPCGILFWMLTVAVIHNSIQMGSAAAVFFALGIVLVIGACLGICARRIKVPILFLIIAAVALVALYNDKKGHYSVGRRADISEFREDMPERKPLSDEYDDWLKKVPKPVMLLVAAAGGASRAGAWTGAVLAELDRQTKGKARGHIFAINAVSGGAVGAAGYVAHVRLGTPHGTLHEPLKTLTGSDALSPTINSMMFPNLLAQLWTHPRLPDRAEALETAWEEAWNASSPSNKDEFGQGLLSFNTSTGAEWVPILIVQGAQLETGRRILTSRVNFQAGGNVNADDFYALANREIRVSTAIHNGARFPYLSPAGVIKTNGKNLHIVDGGYFDNSGVETIRELGQALKRKNNNVAIKYLVIKYEGEERKTWMMPNEMFGPMRALLSSRGGHSAHIRDKLDIESDGGVFEVILKDCVKINKDGEPVMNKDGKPEIVNVPMNWALSRQIQDYIQNSANQKNADECMPSGASGEIERLAKAIND